MTIKESLNLSPLSIVIGTKVLRDAENQELLEQNIQKPISKIALQKEHTFGEVIEIKKLSSVKILTPTMLASEEILRYGATTIHSQLKQNSKVLSFLVALANLRVRKLIL